MNRESLIKFFLILVIGLLTYQFGFKPALEGKSQLQKRIKLEELASNKTISDSNNFDVVIIGEEPEGIAAAISASRMGAKTLLISNSTDLGGSVLKNLKVDLQPNFDEKGVLLNRGIYNDLRKLLGDVFTPEGYLNAINKLVNTEKDLAVLTSANIVSKESDGDRIKSIKVSQDKKERIISGKMFIDATKDGVLLQLCNVPYFTGSEDINFSKIFTPAKLNFEISSIKWKLVNDILNSEYSEDFYNQIKEFEFQDENILLQNLKFIRQPDDKAIVEGFELKNLDLSNKSSIKEEYKKSKVEVEKFIDFLRSHLSSLKDIKLSRIADEFSIEETKHFMGEHVLKVNEILENTNFESKISLGSYPVDASKFIFGEGKYIVGKPNKYSIPMGCIVPLKTKNLLMVGNKASYSSLASSSAGNIGVNISVGQASGIISVYSILNDISPKDILETKDTRTYKEINSLFKRQGMYLPEFEVKNKDADNWSFPALMGLCNLGLIAGGTENDYKFDLDATSRSFATILINGVYKLSKEHYSVNFDNAIRRYYEDKILDVNTAGEILLTFHGVDSKGVNPYEKAVSSGFINEKMKEILDKKNTLTMDDVYYLAAYNIELLTEKKLFEDEE